MKERIENWKKMVDCGDDNAAADLEKITAEAKAEGKIQEMAEAVAYLMQSASQTLDAVENSIEEYTMHQRMGDLPEIINLAYIARHYFGKTRQWLYQRLKGQMVNGKPAAFTPSEKAVFIGALDDIGLRIANFTQQA